MFKLLVSGEFFFATLLPMLVETKQYLKPHTTQAIFFLCPYATPISKLHWPIRSLQRAGYSVIAIGYPESIFSTGETERLFTAVDETKEYIKDTIKDLHSQGYTEFGFVGSSLGGFVIYNCLNDIPELAWGIFGGGNITEAIWSFRAEREQFEARGLSRKDVERAWHSLQYPELGDLSTKRYILITSKGDKTASYTGAMEGFKRIKTAGPKVKIIMHRNLSHRKTVIINLLRIRGLVRKARSL